MGSFRIKSFVGKSVERVFAFYAELQKTATFKKIVAYVPDPLTGVNVNEYATAEVEYIPLRFESADVNGSSVVYGDEKWLVRQSELAAISPLPTAGDWFERGAERYDIRGALLDPTDTVWTFHIRRYVPTPIGTVAVDDYGDLTVWTSNEAWGDLSSFDSREDWNG